MVDIGSRINLIGEDTDREFRELAESHGHKVQYDALSHLKVGGVGQGTSLRTVDDTSMNSQPTTRQVVALHFWQFLGLPVCRNKMR